MALSQLRDLDEVSNSGTLSLAANGTVGFHASGGKLTIGGAVAPGVELEISGTDGLVLPGGTTAQRPAGATGALRWNSDDGQPEIYDGTEWRKFGMVSTPAGSASVLLDTALAGGNTFNATVTGYELVFLTIVGLTHNNNRDVVIDILSGGSSMLADLFYTNRIWFPGQTTGGLRSVGSGGSWFIAENNITDITVPFNCWFRFYLPTASSGARYIHSYGIIVGEHVNAGTNSVIGYIGGYVEPAAATYPDTIQVRRLGGGNFTAGRLRVVGIDVG